MQERILPRRRMLPADLAMAYQPTEQRREFAIKYHKNLSEEKNRPGVTLGGVREELEEGDSGPKHLNKH
jgi:hypothetical protein